MKQTQNTRVVSGGRRSRWREERQWQTLGRVERQWRAHWREREGDGSRLHCTWAAPGQRENTGTVAEMCVLNGMDLFLQHVMCISKYSFMYVLNTNH